MTWLPNNISFVLMALLILGLLHAQVGAAATTLKTWANKMWTWASEVFRDGKPLDLAVKQAAGAIFMTGAGGMVAYSEWILALATLAPLFGHPSPQNISDMDFLLGGALVLSAIVFHIIKEDLATNTSFSVYATTPRARAETLRVVRNMFRLTIIALIAMAVYRMVVLNLEQLMEWGLNPLWVEVPGTGLLVPLAIIFLMAVALCFAHLGHVATLITSLVTTIGAAALGVVWILFAIVAAVGEGMSNFSDVPKKLLAGLGSMFAAIGEWIKKQWRAFREAREAKKKRKMSPMVDLTKRDEIIKDEKPIATNQATTQPLNLRADMRQPNEHPKTNGHEGVYMGSWGRAKDKKDTGVGPLK